MSEAFDPTRGRDSFDFPVVGAPYKPMALAVSKTLQVGSVLTLRPEPSNVHDPLAILVMAGDRAVGYVPNRGNSCGLCFSHVTPMEAYCPHCSAGPESFTTNGKSGLAWRLHKLRTFERRHACLVISVDKLNDQVPLKAQIVLEGN